MTGRGAGTEREREKRERERKRKRENLSDKDGGTSIPLEGSQAPGPQQWELLSFAVSFWG